MARTSSPSRVSSTEPTAEDVRRHQAMVDMAFAWLARTNARQSKLVDLVTAHWRSRGEADFTCDHSMLSRMLHPDVPYIATPRRQQAMRIQEAIMTLCAQRHDVNVIEPAEGAAGGEGLVWSSDDEHAFLANRARLRQVRERAAESLPAMLNLVGELLIHARALDDCQPSNEMGETYRQRGCENALMSLAAMLDRGDTTETLARHLEVHHGMSAAHAAETQQRQLARIRLLLDSVRQPSVNMLAYAGCAMLQCGQRESGMLMLLDAVRRSCDVRLRHDPHWETLLELIERMLVQRARDGERWSEAARLLAAEVLHDPTPQRRDLLLTAWSRLELPQVVAHWSKQDVALVRKLNDRSAAKPGASTRPEDSPEHAPDVSQNSARIVRRVLSAAKLIAVAALLWTLPALAPSAPGREGLADSSGFPTLAMIRGKEARGPSVPPPSGEPPVLTS